MHCHCPACDGRAVHRSTEYRHFLAQTYEKSFQDASQTSTDYGLLEDVQTAAVDDLSGNQQVQMSDQEENTDDLDSFLHEQQEEASAPRYVFY